MSIEKNLQLIVETNNLNEQQLPSDYKYKHFSSLRQTSPDNIEEIGKLLKSKGLSAVTPMGIVNPTLYAIPCERIENIISSLESVNALDLLRQNPELMADNNVLKYYQRIKTCQNHNMEYKDEQGNYAKFIYDDNEWARVMSSSEEQNNAYNFNPYPTSETQVSENQDNTANEKLDNDQLAALRAIKASIQESINSLNSNEDQNVRRLAA